ncbi:MAG TPA: galactokinase family protein, partial [Chitinophagales bacterium]|nr:galactokinase family protein [Chitinophagales bacterium]
MLNTQLLKEEFIHRYGTFVVETYFCPGRVNLIGEHIDYNGGFVLPAAISLGITAIVTRTETDIIRVYSKDFNEEVSFFVKDDFVFHLNEKKHWSDYIKASLQVLKDNGVQLIGADILLASDLPLGSGLSSSAALECLICYIFNENYYNQNRTQLALDAQHAERQYIGV